MCLCMHPSVVMGPASMRNAETWKNCLDMVFRVRKEPLVVALFAKECGFFSQLMLDHAKTHHAVCLGARKFQLYIYIYFLKLQVCMVEIFNWVENRTKIIPNVLYVSEYPLAFNPLLKMGMMKSIWEPSGHTLVNI